jgi:hypothetical protein
MQLDYISTANYLNIVSSTYAIPSEFKFAEISIEASSVKTLALYNFNF